MSRIEGKMKDILITGGAGFIGSNLTKFLLNRGHKVTCFDNFSSGSMENIMNFLKNKRFRFIQGDILDENALKEVIKRKDIVFHLAALLGVSEGVKRPIDIIRADYQGTLNLLNIAHKVKTKKVFFSSSSEVYGKNTKMPLSEESDRVYGSTNISRWAYGTAKSMVEHLLFAFYKKYSLPFAIGRYFNIYGSGSYNRVYQHVITKFTLKALANEDITVYGDGKQKRSFMYIDDAVRATYQVAFETSGEAYNIGTKKAVSMTRLARLIKRLTKSKSKIIYINPKESLGEGFEDTFVRIPNTLKIEKRLHFYPTVELEEGILRTIKYLSDRSK